MATQRHGQIIETPTEARQAEPGPSVLALLTVSTGLAMLILGIVWFVLLPDLTEAGIGREGGPCCRSRSTLHGVVFDILFLEPTCGPDNVCGWAARPRTS